MKGEKLSGQSAAASRLVTGVRGGAIFLLVASAVMLPVAATTGRSLRLLILAVGMAGALFWALGMIFGRRVVLPRGGLAWAGAVVLVVASISGVFSDCYQAALVTVLTWLGYAAAFLLGFWSGGSEPDRRRVVRALCALALPIAAYGVLQYAVLLDLTRVQLEADKAGTLEEMQERGLTERDYPSLVQRTRVKRVFSTFALPNSLAGFLLILIPPSIVLLFYARRRVGRYVLGASVLVILVGLFFTFSTGGWRAGAAVLALFVLTQARGWPTRRWVLTGGGVCGAAAVLAAVLLVSPARRGRMAGMWDEFGGSARVRVQYWAAGVSMWQSRPLLGVGPGNFKNHYMRHQLVAAEEVKHAHNDYVQMLSECGPAAAAGYVAFWVLVIWGAFRRGGPARGEAKSKAGWLRGQGDSAVHRALFPAAGVLGLAGASLLGRSLAVSDDAGINASLVLLFITLWWLAYRASGGKEDGLPSQAALTRGLSLGLVAFVLHSVIDLDLHVEGLGYVAFMVAGLAAAPWACGRPLRLEGSRRLWVLIVVSAAVLGVLYAATRMSQADAYRVSGVRISRSARGASPEARRSLETACRLNPLDHEAFAALGAYYSKRAFVAGGDTADLERAINAWRRAVELNPSFADYHARLGLVFRMVAASRPVVLREYLVEYRQRRAELSLPSPRHESLAAVVPATVELYLATRYAPTQPGYRKLYGEALLLARAGAEAGKQFKAALRLNKAMIEGGAPARQWLSDSELTELRNNLRLTENSGGAIIRK